MQALDKKISRSALPGKNQPRHPRAFNFGTLIHIREAAFYIIQLRVVRERMRKYAPL